MNSPIGQQSKEEPTWIKQIGANGCFIRQQSRFRNLVAPGADFSPEPGRYHLYVSLACPWAQRTMITRALMGLEEVISFDVVDHFLPVGGWTLEAKTSGATLDTVNHKRTLREIYQIAQADYSGSVTVPVLWDRERGTIVNNESAEIIRMLELGFGQLARHPEVDLYPEGYRQRIDEINDWVYESINDGVYRTGFATTQAAYERAATRLFEGLDRAEALLGEQRYLAGDRLTEADVRIFPTLIRFDQVYVTHFKCNLRRLVDYPNLWNYTKELYGYSAFRKTTDFEHIKQHYFRSHESINPHRIVPIGPEVDYLAPHDRGRFPSVYSPAS